MGVDRFFQTCKDERALGRIRRPIDGADLVRTAVSKFPGKLWRVLVARQEATPCFAVTVAGLFCLALSLIHVNHELWRDEIHCWSVARNASGLWDLLTGNRRYDGHPFLWYYLLYLVSRWSRSEVYLHAVTVVLATSSAYLWIRHACLPRAPRLMLLGTYCFFFEYGVISRSYTLGIFLAFLFCRIYDRRQPRILALIVVLVLLSFTSIYGCILAASLGGFLLWESLALLVQAPLARRHRKGIYRQWLLGAALIGFALYVHVKTSLPPADAFYATSTAKGPPLFSSAGFGRQFWSALFPWNRRNDGQWIVSGFLGERTDWLRENLLAAACGLLALWLLALRKAPPVAFALLLGVSGIAVFQARQYAGYLRHWGHFFILLTLASWLFAKRRQARPVLLYLLATITMGSQFATNLRAIKSEIDQPFSGAKEAADFLRMHHLANQPILATYDHACSAIAGYLDPGSSCGPRQTPKARPWFSPTGDTNFPTALHPRVGRRQAPPAGPPGRADPDFGLSESLPTLHTELLYVTRWALRADETFAIYRAETSSGND